VKIPNFEPWLGQEEIDAVTDCILKNWITGGPKVKEFEEKIADLHKVKHAIACMNGTMALFMAIKSLELEPPFEVIVPDFTFIASANAVVLAGGTPVFCDVRKDTFNIDCKSARRVMTKNTKAIMPVHIFGQSAAMDEVMKLAQEKNLKVVEDAAQGVGVSFNGKPVGGIGDVGIISGYADKTICGGELGVVLTNNDTIAENSLCLKHQGRTGRGWYIHDKIGWNFRATDLQAAIMLVQLKKLPFIIHKKRYHEHVYRQMLSGVPQVSFPFEDQRSTSVPFRHNILVKDPVSLQKFLESKGIGIRQFFYPLHKQPCYDDTKTGNGGMFRRDNSIFGNSEWANEHGLSLPSSVTLTEAQLVYICDAIKEFYGS
jgi:perosamine synthetase